MHKALKLKMENKGQELQDMSTQLNLNGTKEKEELEKEMIALDKLR